MKRMLCDVKVWNVKCDKGWRRMKRREGEEKKREDKKKSFKSSKHRPPPTFPHPTSFPHKLLTHLCLLPIYPSTLPYPTLPYLPLPSPTLPYLTCLTYPPTPIKKKQIILTFYPPSNFPSIRIYIFPTSKLWKIRQLRQNLSQKFK